MNTLAWSARPLIPTLGCRSLSEIATEDVEARFAEHGLLRIRGSRADKAAFKAFAERITDRLGVDPFRPVDPDGVQEVNAGLEDIELHAENATTPLRPDLLIFGCAQPAAAGGETTYCDGVRLWDELSDRTRSVFATQRVKYLARFPAVTWRTMLGPGATLGDLARYLDGLGMEYRIADDGSVDTVYLCPATCLALPWRKTAFTNCVLSILADYRDERSRRVVLDDDRPIPGDVIDDLRSTARRLTCDVTWEPGDILILDNWRYLHGRRAYRDRRRCIYVALGWRRGRSAGATAHVAG